MECPRCHAKNAADAGFCDECGSPLEASCPACTAPNRLAAKFCKKCGELLSSPGASGSEPSPKFSSPDSYTPKHLADRILAARTMLEGERKQVTVLFADIVGSTALIDGMDPEDAHGILQPVLHAMMTAVNRYEGTVTRVTGDGIMALFGAPLAHEDHAMRACYASLDVQAAVKKITEEVRNRHGFLVQIRVGLNSGEVVVKAVGNDLRMDYEAIGVTVHLAARMEQLAAPGSIQLTASTLAQAAGSVKVKPLGPVPVKGLSEPVEVYELSGAAMARTRLHAAPGRGLTQFVGRGREMETLARTLRQARDGHGQIVALVGEPGVGKSRLFYEFTRSHSIRDWLVLESGALSFGKARAWAPIVDLLKAYFDIEDEDQRRVAEKVAGKLVMLDDAFKKHLSAFLWLLNVPADDEWERLEPPHRRRLTLDAVKALLVKESTIQPLVLVFEDLHWTDSESLALLDELINALPAARILLLLNYRSEFQHTWGNRTYYTQLRLDPLGVENVDELLTDLLSSDPALSALKRELIARAEGNPLFLEESVQALVGQEQLVGERGRYQFVGDVDALELPATVKAIVTARIDRLAPNDKRLLQTAAVIGQQMPFSLLTAVSEMSGDDIHRSIDHLRSAELLYETQLFPDFEYTFKHAVTYEVAYAALLKERRRELHARTGEAIEQLYGGRLHERAELLAQHFQKGEVWSKAVSYHLRAAERAKARYAYDDAAALCQCALECADQETGMSDERRRAFVLLGDLYSLMDDLEQANQSYDCALEFSSDERVRGQIENKYHHQRYLVRNGAKVAYYEHGRGDNSIVFVNPINYSIGVWQPILERLSHEFHIVTIDPRGCGASDPVALEQPFLDNVADVGAVIEKVGRQTVTGVGSSDGGKTLFKLAHTAPKLVDKLVVVGTGVDPQLIGRPPLHDWDGLSRTLDQGDAEPLANEIAYGVYSEPGMEYMIERTRKLLLEVPIETLKAFLHGGPGYDFERLLPEITTPTLVIYGTADRQISPAGSLYIADHLPNSQLYPFEGKGHLPNFSATAEFCDVLRQFILTGTVAERRADQVLSEEGGVALDKHSLV